MTELDPIYQAEQSMAADVGHAPPAVQQAYRYLFARVALDTGLLELIGHELRPSGERLVCREPSTGKVYQADRPTDWNRDEEALYVAEMRRHLLGPDSA